MARAPPLILLLLSLVPGSLAIGCFVCSSFDGENKACEDPFNSTLENNSKEREAGSVANYHHPCWAFKKGRQGLFPADHCIKINGYRAENSSKTMIIRTCALDSGTLTADTEIVRISHCGHFKYEGHHYSGCVQACDTDGCNTSVRMPYMSSFFYYLISSIFFRLLL